MADIRDRTHRALSGTNNPSGGQGRAPRPRWTDTRPTRYHFERDGRAAQPGEWRYLVLGLVIALAFVAVHQGVPIVMSWFAG